MVEAYTEYLMYTEYSMHTEYALKKAFFSYGNAISKRTPNQKAKLLYHSHLFEAIVYYDFGINKVHNRIVCNNQ